MKHRCSNCNFWYPTLYVWNMASKRYRIKSDFGRCKNPRVCKRNDNLPVMSRYDYCCGYWIRRKGTLKSRTARKYRKDKPLRKEKKKNGSE